MKLIHEDISYRIRGGLFDVQNEVGLGRDEEMYHKAFASWLREHEIPFYSKPRHELRLFDTIAHVLYPDFVVADQVVIELKSRSSALKDGDKAQLVNYLKKNTSLGQGPLDCFLINHQVVLCYTALFDDNGFNCSRTQAFMNSLGVPLGLAVNFGKRNLQLKAFSVS